MSNQVVKPKTGRGNLTGINLMLFADGYGRAAQVLEAGAAGENFDPVLYHLYCRSLELHLKCFIWLVDRTKIEKIKEHYRHDLKMLWEDAKVRKISQFASVTQNRDYIIELVSTYYEKRRFCYLDSEMMFRGFQSLRSETKIIPTLKSLSIKLKQSLEPPILRAT